MRDLNQKIAFTICSLLLMFSMPAVVHSQQVSSWVTTGDQSKLLKQQAIINFTKGPQKSNTTIALDTTSFYQTMDGFGYCLTEGSARLFTTLTPTVQTKLLNELFSVSNGIGISVLRISIGASDLSSHSYSYDDIESGTDVSLSRFSLEGPDLTYLVPVLKKIIAINPKIKLLGSPWSAPKWMKTKNTWIGGSLDTAYYQTYANYFVKYLIAMKVQGIEVGAVTIQNEPENPKNEPSMVMTANEQINFINKNLGPALHKAGLKTKILAFDHNCDNLKYPVEVCNKSPYVDGAAFHLYLGPITMLSTVHKATGKNVYFTEQYTASGSEFSGTLAWHMNNIMIGASSNWAKMVLEWNLANDSKYGPFTPGGCTTCMGAITVNDSVNYVRNVSYYVTAHMSKFVKAGARRIVSSTTDTNLSNVAFKNPDGSLALIVMNNGPEETFNVTYGGKYFTYNLPGSSVVSIVWNNGKFTDKVLAQ